ncbi:MAG: TonB-dependent receptor [Balneolaceae bacterium]|nr:TonB-dependent receptor [Balneolaceae bacterium]
MKRYGFLLIVLLLLPFTVYSQGSTTATITGRVIDQDGEPLAGANIIATHEPTGIEYGTTSRADGRYTLKNLRVGGPYHIVASFVGFKKARKENIELELDQTLTVNFSLEEGNIELSEVTVVAEEDQILNSRRTGARTNVSTREIESLPTISRSIQDFTRLLPQNTGGNSFASRNDRYNNILVDGATLNDVFGLGEATPGSQAGAEPFSLDAIQEFNVDLAPYDVTNSGFTGAQINAITRSGTNQYKGSVYFQGRNENFVGDLPVEGGGTSEFSEFDESFWGFRLGGPIIEDKLFFFVNGELKRRSEPITTGLAGSNAGTIFGGDNPIPSSTLQQIIDISQNQYGYDPGGFQPLSQDQDNNKLLIKLDYNINQNHNLTFRYNFVDADDDDGIFRGQDEFDLSNRQYVFRSKQNSFVADLKSTFSDNIVNEARVVYTRIRDERDVQAEPFPEVSIIVGPDGEAVNLGIDRFSQQNSLDQDLWEITNNVTYFKGNHEITVGTSNQIFTFDNKFLQDWWGSYEFDDIASWQAGDPSSYNYSFSRINDPLPTANWTGLQFGLYAQDKWTIKSNFTLTFGLRADLPVFPDDPLSNPDVPDAFPGFSTSTVPNGNILWSPRVGFNWDLNAFDRKTQVRGGIGIFSGDPPYVWVSNLYSNTGVDVGRIDVSGASAPNFSPDPFDQPGPGEQGLSAVATTEINLVSDDFKFPQTLRTNIAVDHALPYGLIGTVEAIFSSNINDVVYRNINIGDPFGEPIGTAVGNRPLYGPPGLFTSSQKVDSRFTNALLLENTNEGYEFSLTAKLEKTTDFGLSGSLAYTHNDAESVINATSSRAISNWQFQENRDVNNPDVGRSDFEVLHRFVANFVYNIEKTGTTVSMFYEGRSGRPFSWIYFGDANGDGQSFNDLVFVPAAEDDIVLFSNNWAELDAFISNTPSLNDHRGEIVPRHNDRQPWRNILDIKIAQKIPGIPVGDLELSANFLNVLNLLNEDWGEVEFSNFNNETVFTIFGYDAQGRPLMSFSNPDDGVDSFFERADLSSRWQIQFGVRYTF